MLTWRILALIAASVCCSAAAQLALKQGMSQAAVQAALDGRAGAAAVGWAVVGSAMVWAGLAAYGLSAALWLFVLARLDVSVAYAFVSLGFLAVMALGVVVFGEPIGPRKVVGTVLVAAGIWLVATSAGVPSAGSRAGERQRPIGGPARTASGGSVAAVAPTLDRPLRDGHAVGSGGG